MTIRELVATAYGESIPRHDLTTVPFGASVEQVNARLIAREDLVLAGRDVFELAVRARAPASEFEWQFGEGEVILNGQTICWIRGEPAALLGAERVAVDLTSRACGIASLTRCFVERTGGTRAVIVGAVVATPGWGEFERRAIRAGGGAVEDDQLPEPFYLTLNCARVAGSLERALQLVRAEYAGPVAVECATEGDVTTAVTARVAHVVLIEPDDALIATARARVPALIQLEVGGALRLADAERLARAGVDLVRVDQLTTAAPPAALALIIPRPPAESR